MNQDEKYMRQALVQAKKAYALEEVPIGCVIVHKEKILKFLEIRPCFSEI